MTGLLVVPVVQDTEACEVCGEVGKVLLCDTCPRVFHLSCVDPPLSEVPEGDWSCDFCVSRGVDHRWDGAAPT